MATPKFIPFGEEKKYDPKWNSAPSTLPFGSTSIKDTVAQHQAQEDGNFFKEKNAGKTGAKILNTVTEKAQELGKNLGQALGGKSQVKQYKDAAQAYEELSTDMVSRIEKAKSEGKSPEYVKHLQDQFKNLKAPQMNDYVSDEAKSALETTKNPEKVAGLVAGTALEALSGGAVGATKTAVTSKVLSTGQKVAKSALIGAGYGSVAGATDAMSEGGSLGDIAKKTATGGITGAAVGAVTGAIGTAVTNKLNKVGAIEKKAKKAFDAITPKPNELTANEYDKLLSQGKITPKTKTQPAQYILSKEEKATATKYKDLLQEKDPVKNSINITEEIGRKDAEVEQFLTENNGIFNGGELKNFINEKLKGLSDVNVPESRVTKLKKTMIDNFMTALEKKDIKTLWQARKNFDKQIESAFGGSPSLTNQAKKEFRNAIQEFISERTPDSVYKGKMKDMTELFNIRDVVNTRAGKEKLQTGITAWIKENPAKAQAVKWIIGTLGAYKAAEVTGIIN